MSFLQNYSPKTIRVIITTVSIVIPIVVALLFSVNLRDLGYDVAPLTFLPPIYATINGITAVLLLFALAKIKAGDRVAHERFINYAMICSLAFLVMYVAYHMTSTSVVFGDLNHDGLLDATEKAAVGSLRGVYLFILISHILLSIIIVPLVLITYMHGALNQVEKHRKIAKITFPIWLYVAITGVVVYLMISPYYV